MINSQDFKIVDKKISTIAALSFSNLTILPPKFSFLDFLPNQSKTNNPNYHC